MPLSRLERPASGVVHLWFLDLLQLGSPLEAGKPPQVHEFSPTQHRTLRRFYLRLLLGAYLGMPGKMVKISRLIKGKPVLAGPEHARPLDFSMSSSDGCCLIGVAGSGLVGVDLEVERRRVEDPLRLARRYFSAEEIAALESSDAETVNATFMHVWACNEAVVKAAGHGLANQLDRFTVLIDPNCGPRMAAIADDDASAWRLALVRPSRRHIAAVALRDEQLHIEAFRLLPPRLR
jgi:4'-phosphopantetheinyl transferase